MLPIELSWLGLFRQIILWWLFTRFIWLTPFKTRSITYACQWIHQIPTWNVYWAKKWKHDRIYYASSNFKFKKSKYFDLALGFTWQACILWCPFRRLFPDWSWNDILLQPEDPADCRQPSLSSRPSYQQQKKQWLFEVFTNKLRFAMHSKIRRISHLASTQLQVRINGYQYWRLRIPARFRARV